jgi:hypothetical protein
LRKAVLAYPILLLSGCSIPHPLEYDVTDLPLADLVQKITCEARDALDEALVSRHVIQERKNFKLVNSKLDELRKKFDLDNEKEELLKKKKELDFEIAANTSHMRYLLVRLGEMKKLRKREAGDEESEPTPEEIKDEKKYEDAKKIKTDLLYKVWRYNNKLKLYNKKSEEASEVIDEATKKAGRTNFKLSQYYNNSIAFKFNFHVIETNETTASLSWKLPLAINANQNSLTLGGGAGDTNLRDSERTVKTAMTLEDLHGIDCSRVYPDADVLRRVHYPITGEIGIREVMDQYFRIVDKSIHNQEFDQQKNAIDIKKLKSVFDKTDAYTDTILFTTTLTGSLTPSIALNPTLRESASASIGSTHTRVDKHSVLIALSPSGAGDAKEQIQKVIVLPNDALAPQ